MTNERQDDEILGRALSRAIETIDVNETPFERSRLATTPARRSIFGVWQIATAAAAIMLALAIGSWLSRPSESQPGVAASPTVPASSPATVGPTASPVQAPSVPIQVYFARDGLPPVGASIDAHASSAVLASAEGRILARISALSGLGSDSIPAGATNPMSLVARPAPTAGSSQGSIGTSVSIQGDVAKVEFDLSPGWGIRGAAQSQALLQQLVYTITEEPGIRRALLTEKGKPNAVIDQLVVDKPLSREDVFGYADPATPDKIQDRGSGQTAEIADWRASVDEVAPGLGRFVVEFKPSAGSTPGFVAQLARPIQETRTEDGKWVINLTMPDALWNQPAGEAFHCCPLKAVGKTPIIEVAAYPLTGEIAPNGMYKGVGFAIVLDDARPWRVFTLSNPARIVVDMGGPTQFVSDRIAVYQLLPGAIGSRELQVTGAARVFEASVSWRLKDQSGREVGSGHFLASLGSSAVWGTFDTRIATPASLTGPGTLELFEASAKDGTPQGLVQIPLGVR